MFRAVSVFPGPFTLEGAEAVAGAGAGPAVLHLVDCSLLVPPRAGPDGRSRYVMLETLRAYGAGLLAEAGEQAKPRGRAGRVRAAGGRGRHGGAAGRRPARWPRPGGWMPRTPPWRQVLDWAVEHDAGRWRRGWRPRWRGGGRSVAGWRVRCPLLRAAVDRAAAGSDAWCAGHIWLGQARWIRPIRPARCATSPRSATPSGTAAVPAAGQCLSGRSATLSRHGPDRRGGRRCPPFPGSGPASGGYPACRGLALAVLSLAACVGGDRAVPCSWPGRRSRSRRHARPGGPGVRPHPD